MYFTLSDIQCCTRTPPSPSPRRPYFALAWQGTVLSIVLLAEVFGESLQLWYKGITRSRQHAGEQSQGPNLCSTIQRDMGSQELSKIRKESPNLDWTTKSALRLRNDSPLAHHLHRPNTYSPLANTAVIAKLKCWTYYTSREISHEKTLQSQKSRWPWKDRRTQRRHSEQGA